MKKLILMLFAFVMLLTLNANAQLGSFSLLGQRFKISKTTLNYIGTGGDGHIWSFTAYDNYGSNELQLYITNDSAEKVAGTNCRPYNEWAHVAVIRKEEHSYAYPKATIERSGMSKYKITIVHDDCSLSYIGPLEVTSPKEENNTRVKIQD